MVTRKWYSHGGEETQSYSEYSSSHITRTFLVSLRGIMGWLVILAFMALGSSVVIFQSFRRGLAMLGVPFPGSFWQRVTRAFVILHFVEPFVNAIILTIVTANIVSMEINPRVTLPLWVMSDARYWYQTSPLAILLVPLIGVLFPDKRSRQICLVLAVIGLVRWIATVIAFSNVGFYVLPSLILTVPIGVLVLVHSQSFYALADKWLLDDVQLLQQSDTRKQA